MIESLSTVTISIPVSGSSLLSAVSGTGDSTEEGEGTEGGGDTAAGMGVSAVPDAVFFFGVFLGDALVVLGFSGGAPVETAASCFFFRHSGTWADALQDSIFGYSGWRE